MASLAAIEHSKQKTSIKKSPYMIAHVWALVFLKDS